MAGTAVSYKDGGGATRNRSVTTAATLDIGRQILVDETDTPSLGAAADAAASSDTGTFSLIALFKRLLGKLPTLGPKAASGSVSVTLSTDDDLLIGSLTETAPATDIASSGLNGRLQRIAQNLSALIALLPTALGQGTMAQSLRVVLSSDQTPLRISGPYNSTVPFFSAATQAELQMTTRGSARVFPVGAASTIANGLASTVTMFGREDSISTGVHPLGIIPYKHNGTTLDVDRKPNGISRIASAAASTNVTSAKGSAADVHLVSGTSARATVCYFKVWNKATAATVGTDVPVLVREIAPTAAFMFDLKGQYLSAGYSYAFTTGPTDGDTGALTAGDITSFFTTFA
ncbi:hypothetical protein [Mesorhizobium sp. M0520]|uniref:hypothetical protein n=1 Tax=Mesorhizobium sp. M0520 TaxID=2956957 RepID=UPI00333CDED6